MASQSASRIWTPVEPALFCFPLWKKAPALFRSENQAASLFAMAMASRAVVTAYHPVTGWCIASAAHWGGQKGARLVNDGRHKSSDAQVSQRAGPAGAEELPSQAMPRPSEEERLSLVACFTVHAWLSARFDSSTIIGFWSRSIDRLISH
jgi:hypothetical protein